MDWSWPHLSIQKNGPHLGNSRDNLHVQALKKRSCKLVNILQQSYSASLSREPALLGLLQRIKTSYVGVPPASGMQGLLSGMMQMLTSS